MPAPFFLTALVGKAAAGAASNYAFVATCPNAIRNKFSSHATAGAAGPRWSRRWRGTQHSSADWAKADVS
jgi:hypothetical protein